MSDSGGSRRKGPTLSLAQDRVRSHLRVKAPHPVFRGLKSRPLPTNVQLGTECRYWQGAAGSSPSDPTKGAVVQWLDVQARSLTTLQAPVARIKVYMPVLQQTTNIDISCDPQTKHLQNRQQNPRNGINLRSTTARAATHRKGPYAVYKKLLITRYEHPFTDAEE